jgi:hypothetical protein
MACAGPPTPCTSKELILVESGLGSRPSLWTDADADRIAALPFDGICLDTVTSWHLMDPRQPFDEERAESDLGNVAKLDGAKRLFQRVICKKYADMFDDDGWQELAGRWRVMAQVSQRHGLAGVVFDNEEYFVEELGSLWSWSPDSGRDLDDARRAARQRGREIMRALGSVWPDVVVLVMHGPYVSEAKTPPEVTLRQVEASGEDLRGWFFVGLVEGAAAGARVVDGGEVYQYRSDADFEASYRWRKTGIASDRVDSSVIPPELRRRWSASVGVSFGVYDQAWKDGFPMDPARFEETLVHALFRADRYVWMWSEESSGDLAAGTQDEVWLDAVRRARSRVR